MAIGNTKRGRAKARLRLRADGSWWVLSREPLGFVGPWINAEDAYRFAVASGNLWRDGDLEKAV